MPVTDMAGHRHERIRRPSIDCPDQKGLVATVSGTLSHRDQVPDRIARGCNLERIVL
jgi:formyltetrahydrofolate hydrolase